MADGMAPQGAPAPEGAPPAGGEQVAQAVQMIGSGMEALIASAPNPEVAQALQQVQAQLGQILQSGAPASQPGPVSPEAGANPNVVPAG